MITMEARQLLAEEFTKRNQPWFATDILKGQSKQFDAALTVITAQLEPRKYCRYDLPGNEAIDHHCRCGWCNPHD